MMYIGLRYITLCFSVSIFVILPSYSQLQIDDDFYIVNNTICTRRETVCFTDNVNNSCFLVRQHINASIFYTACDSNEKSIHGDENCTDFCSLCIKTLIARTSGCNYSLPHAGVNTALCCCHNISETEKGPDLNVNIRLGRCKNCSQDLHFSYLNKENASETMLNFTLNFQEICSEIFQNQSMGPTVTESVQTSIQPSTLSLSSQELPQSTIPTMTTKSNPPRSWIMANRYCCNSSHVLVSTKDDTWMKHSNTSMMDDSTEVWLDEVLSLGPWVMIQYLKLEEYDFKNMTDSTSEKLKKAYGCTDNCQNENYFQVNIYEKDVECGCFNNLPKFQKQSGSIIVGQNINQIITRTNVADDNLTSIEGDICIVAHLNSKARPITYTLREQRCSRSSGILCQKEQGAEIEYYFSEKDVTFMDGVLYCENISAVLFSPITFQSRALEKTKYFAKYVASNVQVWTGIFKRNTWIQTFCDLDYSPDHCKVKSMNGTVREVDCGESHTTVCSTGVETTFQSTTSVILTTDVDTTQFTSEVVSTESTNLNQVSTAEIENTTITAVNTTSSSPLDLSTLINTTATTGTLVEIKTTELITTTEDPNKKTWSEWLESCCGESKILYYEGMEVEDDHFNLSSEMKNQKLDEIYINSRLDVGNWILFVGTFTTNHTIVSMSDEADIYECASMCKHCWYFGLKNRSCLNISTISYLDEAMNNEGDIELFTSKGVGVIEDVVPSIGMEFAQIDLNTDVYPAVYTLTVRDSNKSAKALCQTDDSKYFTSTEPMDFETSEEFCNNISAKLGFSFSSFHFYQNRLGTGTYWTSITRMNNLFNTDCENSKIGRYCRKLLLSGEIVTRECTEKMYTICVKEKKTTTSSTTTTTTTTSTTSTPTTTTTVPDTTQTSLKTIPTTTTKTTPRPLVEYAYEVLYGHVDKEEAARQCEANCGRLWSSDLPDMDMVNVTDILDMNSLNETWTNYQLYVSPWVVSTGLTSNVNAFVHNITMTRAEPFHCATQCQAFPKFVLLADTCYCLLSGTSIERYYNQTTAVVYDTLRDFSMDADELTEADKQCTIAVINYKVFPITYTLQQAPCDGTHSVICQDIKDQTIRYSYIYTEKGTYSEAAGACLNSSMTVFNPFNFNPSLFATLLNLTAAVTVWTAVTREFYWWTRTEEFVKYKRPYCQLLGINGTLSSQPCSSKKSSLCFIERYKENWCSAGSFSSTSPPSIGSSYPKDSITTKSGISVTETTKGIFSTITNTTLNNNKSDKTEASKTKSSVDMGMYVGIGVASLFVPLVLLIGVIYIRRRKSRGRQQNRNGFEMNESNPTYTSTYNSSGGRITESDNTTCHSGTSVLLNTSEDVVRNGVSHEIINSSDSSNAPDIQNEPPIYSQVNRGPRQNREIENGNTYIDTFPLFNGSKRIHNNTFSKNQLENTQL